MVNRFFLLFLPTVVALASAAPSSRDYRLSITLAFEGDHCTDTPESVDDNVLWEESRRTLLENNMAGLSIPLESFDFTATTGKENSGVQVQQYGWCDPVSVDECIAYYGQSTCVRLCTECEGPPLVTEDSPIYISNLDQQQACLDLQDHVMHGQRADCLKGAMLTGCDIHVDDSTPSN